MENLGINYPIVGVPNFDPYPNDVLVMCGTITTHSITVSEKMLFFFFTCEVGCQEWWSIFWWNIRKFSLVSFFFTWQCIPIIISGWLIDRPFITGVYYMIFLCPTCTVRTCSWVMICLSGYYPLTETVGCTSISRPHFSPIAHGNGRFFTEDLFHGTWWWTPNDGT